MESYDWDSPLDEDLAGVPAEIRDEYEALLDYYDRDELEDIRKNFGDKWIKDLFVSDLARPCNPIGSRCIRRGD